MHAFYTHDHIRSSLNKNISYGHVLQCIIYTVLLILALIAGGVASAVNAAEVQDYYVDGLQCDNLGSSSFYIGIQEELCYDLKQIRNSQAASTVSIDITVYIHAVTTL